MNDKFKFKLSVSIKIYFFIREKGKRLEHRRSLKAALDFVVSKITIKE